MSHPWTVATIVASRSPGKIQFLDGGTRETNGTAVLEKRLRGWGQVLKGVQWRRRKRKKAWRCSAHCTRLQQSAREAAAGLSAARSDCARSV